MEAQDIQGIAIIIDDQINDKNANINKIVDQLNTSNVPFIKFTAIPSDEIVKHFHGISFVILDWDLKGDLLDEETLYSGVKLPESVSKDSQEKTINFIRLIKNKCFSPVFILTNHSPEDIKKALNDNDVLLDGKPNFVFVKSKSDVTEGKLFSEILAWIKNSPSIYVLNEWEREYFKAKNKLFSDFYDMSPAWPKVLWKTSSNDGINASLNLGNIISRNLHTRMSPFEFDESIIYECNYNADIDETRAVIQGERFIDKDGLHDDSISTGDMYCISQKLYINIRPECDCVINRNQGQDGADADVELYLLRVNTMNKKKETEEFNSKYGSLNEPEVGAVVFCMYKNKSIRLSFKDIKIKKWSEIKDKRVGRLLPPYITRIQQRYSHYLQRQGQPRIPDIAIAPEGEEESN